MLSKINSSISGISVIIIFWGLFWLLNGLDKFYNGKNAPNLEPFSTKSVLVSPNDRETILYEVHPTEPIGWFGVNRDAKMVGYFNRLGISSNIAIISLYFIACIEILVGLGFLFDIVTKKRKYDLVRFMFKISMLIFFCFSIFDILFGDRTELWEHGTFLLLATIHYIYILFAVPGKEFDQLRDKLYSNMSSKS